MVSKSRIGQFRPLAETMKYSTEVTPNRVRGYDACVSVSYRGEQIEFIRLNARNEIEARDMADKWIAANKAEQRAANATQKRFAYISEGELESREAARNERDYQ